MTSNNFPILGTTAPGFEAVREVFADNFIDGIEVGASLCVRRNGEDLINLWGGYQDSAMQRPWLEDTLVNVYSTTKGIAALGFAAAVEAGHLHYDDPVCDLWPEFVAGKDGLTSAQLLSHQSGVPGVSTRLTVADMYNWPKMIGLLAAQEPYWPPGSAAGYHAVHWGYLVGELIIRATGKTLGQWVAEALAGPLQADFFLGLPAAKHARCADMIGPNRARTAANQDAPEVTPQKMPKLFPVALMNPSIKPFKDACSAEWRSAEIAAANGQASGAGVARIYDAAANGGASGAVKVMHQSTIEIANIEEIGLEEDLILGKPMRRSRGFILNTNGEYGPTNSAFGHAGAGGSLGFADPEFGIGFGYVMNQMQPGVVEESRSDRLVAALYDALQKS